MKNNRRGRLGKARKLPACEEYAITDRLSYLPDCIIHHILSFLDTKCAVQTSVLSTRWRCAWKHVSVLNLCSGAFQNNDEGFSTFVDKVLSLCCSTNVSEISYVNSIYEDESRMEDDDPLAAKVVEYAVSHETQHLVLCLKHGDVGLFKFPQSYGSTPDFNLKTLCLTGCVVDDRLVSCRFLMLTTLELVSCMFVSDDDDPLDLISNFPCLKNLVIDTSYRNIGMYDEHRRFRIAGPQLQDLKLLYVEFGKMEVSAPKLESFELLDAGRSLEFSELALPSLDYANLNIDCYYLSDSEFSIEDLVIMFEGCRNVKSLTIGRNIMKVLSEDAELLDEEQSPFWRLEKLTLVCKCSNIPYKVVSYFLRGSSSTSPSIQVINDP